MRPMREACPSSLRPWTSFAASSVGLRPQSPKVHIGFRLASDVVASIKASGRGYNARVEQALRAAGFGGKNERELSEMEVVKKRRPAKQRKKPAVGERQA